MSETRAPDAPADPMVGALVAGRYRIVRRLAQGGMGIVYEATQEPLGRRVALKVIRGDADDVARPRFEREAKAASALQDPHVVVVHDFGVLDDGPGGKQGLFIAMEFLEGDTLRQRLSRGRLSFAQSRAVIRQIAQALAHAHERGLVHRDLKPENVILVDDRHGRVDGAREGPADLRVKVLDFGLAKGTASSGALLSPSDQPLTRSGGFVGTPGYIGPEVLDGKGDDPRQDIYALGVVWWELVTGMHPFPAQTPMKTLLRQMHEEAPNLDELTRAQAGIPDPGAALIRTLMARDPGARPRDGRDVLARLDDLDRQVGTSDTRIDAAVPGVDINAITIAGEKKAIGSEAAPRAAHSGFVADGGDGEGATTVEARRRPTELSRPAGESGRPSPETPPTSSQAIAAPAPGAQSLSSGGRRRIRNRERMLIAVALASVLGTIGGVIGLKVIESAPPIIDEPPEPPLPPPVPAPPAITATDLHIDGVPSFVGLKALRDALPAHTLRVYRQGKAELILAGDVSGALADTLTAADVVIDDTHWHVEVTEIVDGRLSSFMREGPPGTKDEDLLAPDAGVTAPGGLEP